ncbi:MAG: Omp28-related outer membrane protein [Bacteroidales bacterium]|jgi:hypothetical protein
MKRNILYIVAIIIGLSFAFSSCDVIDSPYVEKQEIDTSFNCVTPDFPTVQSPYKRVLLEDYTGHLCVNCPKAALIASDLKARYKDTLVVVAVHAGFFANPAGGYDFRTTCGTEWDDYFKVGLNGNPNGMINRLKYLEGAHVYQPSAWGNGIKEAKNATPEVELQVINDYDAELDNLCIHTKTTFLTPISNRALNLNIVIIQDKIIAPQHNNDPNIGTTPTIEDYEHNHVLVGAVNGTWGTPILSADETSADPIIKTFPVHVKGVNTINTPVPENCTVVAFISDLNTREILQVTECKVVINE